jgi:hypothetical protein
MRFLTQEHKMKAGIGLVGILVALVVVALLVQKSLKGEHTAAANAASALQHASGQTVHVDPQANVAEQSKQLQAQIRAQVEAAQAPQRQMPDE